MARDTALVGNGRRATAYCCQWRTLETHQNVQILCAILGIPFSVPPVECFARYIQPPATRIEQQGIRAYDPVSCAHHDTTRIDRKVSKFEIIGVEASNDRCNRPHT